MQVAGDPAAFLQRRGPGVLALRQAGLFEQLLGLRAPGPRTAAGSTKAIRYAGPQQRLKYQLSGRSNHQAETANAAATPMPAATIGRFPRRPKSITAISVTATSTSTSEFEFS